MAKILIVEDEEMLASMYKERFEREGFEVAEASSVDEAVRKAKEEKPNIILLDILLKDSTGISFLRQKNQIPEIASIPVLAFSNYDDPATKKQAFELGALEYLIKTNYTPQQVVDHVKNHLAR